MLESMKKFGMKYCDLSTMIENVSFMLRLLTLNIDPRDMEAIPISNYIAIVLIAMSYFYVYLISTFWFVFIRNDDDTEDKDGHILCKITVASLGITSEIGVTKLICMLLNRSTVRKIVKDCLACDALVKPGSRFKRNLMKHLRIVKKRAIIYWAVIIGNGIVYVGKAILLPGRHHMEDCFTILGFDPMFQSPNYEIVFIINAAGVFFTCYLPANISAFLIIVVGYIEAQILALNEELRSLWQDAIDHYNNKIVNAIVETSHVDNVGDRNKTIDEFIKKRLEEIVQTHTIIIDLLRQVEDLFRTVIGIEFIVLIIGLIAELLGGLEKTYIELPFALMMVGMDCLVGQRLTDASVIFQNAVYECRWENFNAHNMKMIPVILLNAQNMLTLSAGGVAQLSFSCFMSVIRSIYSAYTTLRTTM